MLDLSERLESARDKKRDEIVAHLKAVTVNDAPQELAELLWRRESFRLSMYLRSDWLTLSGRGSGLSGVCAGIVGADGCVA